MKKSINYLLSIYYSFYNSDYKKNHKKKFNNIKKEYIFSDKDISIEEFYRNFHNIYYSQILSIKNLKNHIYNEDYIPEKSYLFYDNEIHIDIELKEIERIEFENKIDYINSQMNNDFPPIL